MSARVLTSPIGRIQSAEIYFVVPGWRVGRGERMLFMVSGRVLEYTETSGDRGKQRRARERESLAWVENSLWPD